MIYPIPKYTPIYNKNMKIVREINDKWSEYDKMVAQCQMMNYGKIFIDEYGEPIDDEYLIEEYNSNGEVF